MEAAPKTLHSISAARTPPSSVFLEDVTALTLARLHLARNRPDDALSQLAATKANAAAQGRCATEIECGILSALAHQARGDSDQARLALADALRLARPEGYVRLFLDAGVELAPLLRAAASHGTEPEYARRLADLLMPPAPAPSLPARPAGNAALLDPLTDREIEVLHLVADGLSNQDIAERLFLSVGTVKRHVHNIFGKLDVGGRVEAIARARSLGIL
jgi:LuxR family transcriptional regulator, maltose regulon positive regulatory protein